MKKKMTIALLSTFLLVGGGFLVTNNIAETNDPAVVKAESTDNSTHSSDTAYLTIYINYAAASSSFTKGAAIHYYDNGKASTSTWPGEPVTSIRNNVATLYMPIPTGDYTTGTFNFNNNNNNWQTGDLTYTNANDGDTWVITGTDNKTTEGFWTSSISTKTWTIPGSHNDWNLSTSTAAEGSSVSVELTGETGQFKILCNGTADATTGAWTQDYSIDAGSNMYFGDTYTSLGGHYDYFNTGYSGANIYVATGYSGTYTFTFGEGLYDALMSNRDISSLLTVTYKSSSQVSITYAPVVVAGNHGQTSTISADSGTNLSAVVPELYGYTFGGWYTDKSLTTAVAETATIDTYSGGAWIYAKFTADSTLTETYTLDFSEALGVFCGTDSKAVCVHYWSDNGASVFPGINLGYGSSLTGVYDIALPNDITGLNISCFSSDYSFVDSGDYKTQIARTKDVTITSTNPNEVFLDGNTDSGDYGNYYAYQADDGYKTIKDALTGLIEGCKTTKTGSAPSEAMETAWKTINSTTSTYKTNNNLQTMGANAKANTWSIAGCLSRYDYIVGKYGSALGDTYNPLGRPITTDNNPLARVGEAGTDTYVAVIAMTAFAGVSTLAYLFLKRKRERA